MGFLSIAAAKRNSWIYRTYLVLMVLCATAATAVIGGLWGWKYFGDCPLNGAQFAMACGVAVLPVVLLWVGCRVILFIAFGRDAFG